MTKTSGLSLYEKVLAELEVVGNYERSAKTRDISKLEGMRILLKDLGNPQENYNIIHIAGTNGKGLTGAMLSRILYNEGRKVGFYSSPHVVDIRERITLGKEMISRETFATYSKKVLEQRAIYGESVYLSYFDVLTAIALLAFAKSGTEYVILETGLGGRADSTNIVDKQMAIITRIGYDHLHVLGDSLEKITNEKIGIARPYTPTVVATQYETLNTLIKEQLKKIKSPYVSTSFLNIEPDSFDGEYVFSWGDNIKYTLRTGYTKASIPYLECAKNALIARHTLDPESSTISSRKAWCKAVFEVNLPGRLQYLTNVRIKSSSPTINKLILDGGHNADSIEALVNQLKIWNVTRYILIIGFASDKLITPIKRPLVELCAKADRIIFTRANSSRASKPQQIKEFLESEKNFEEVTCSFNYTNSIDEALNNPSITSNLPIVICGSFYLIGEVADKIIINK